MLENTNYGYVLGTVAGALQIAGYLLYILQMLKGGSVPNAVSWTLWFFMIILNAASYFQMSDDWVKTILPAVSGLMMIVIYALLVFKIGIRFNRLNKTEWAVFLIGISACFSWWLFKSAALGNLIFQIAFFLSFVPTVRGVWKNPSVEKPAAWIVFSVAYLFAVLVVISRWRGQVPDLIFPVNAFFLHASVAAHCLRKTLSGKTFTLKNTRDLL